MANSPLAHFEATKAAVPEPQGDRSSIPPAVPKCVKCNQHLKQNLITKREIFKQYLLLCSRRMYSSTHLF